MKSNFLVYGIVGLIAFAIVGNILKNLGIEQQPKPQASQPAPVTSTPTKPRVQCPKGTVSKDWQSPLGSYWTGVELYQGEGECKKYLATVLGGNSKYKAVDGSTVNAVKLKYANGEIDWKSREAVSQQAFIAGEDPALQARKWVEYDR